MAPLLRGTGHHIVFQRRQPALTAASGCVEGPVFLSIRLAEARLLHVEVLVVAAAMSQPQGEGHRDVTLYACRCLI